MHPGALVAYLTGLLVVVIGGSVLMFRIKGGTVRVLVEAEHDAPAIEHPPLTLARVRQAARFSLDRFGEGSDRFSRRFLRLGLAAPARVRAERRGVLDRGDGRLSVDDGSDVDGAGLDDGGGGVAVFRRLAHRRQSGVPAAAGPRRGQRLGSADCGAGAAGAARARAAPDRRHLRGDAGVGRAGDGRLGAGHRSARLHRLCADRGPGRAASAAAGLARARPVVPVPRVGRPWRLCRCRCGGPRQQPRNIPDSTWRPR